MSIKINLENINCYSKFDIAFNNYQITLLKGPSGIGKSSIFQAISWCLYGKLKGICGFFSKKYAVSITFGDFNIYRKGKPKLLQISMTGNSIIYEDDIAQQLIDQYFGTEDIWYASCYIEQDIRSPLLSGSNNQRMELLNKLSFWSDNPDYYLEKIDDEIKIQQSKLIQEQSFYKAQCDLFTQQLIKKPIDQSLMNQSITNDYLDNINNNIKILQEDINKLNMELQVQHKISGSLETLKSTLYVNINKLNLYKSIENYDLLISEQDIQLLNENKMLDNIKENINKNDDGIRSKISQTKSKIKELETLINQRQLHEKNILMYEDIIYKYNIEKNKLEENLKIKKTLIDNKDTSKQLTRNDLLLIQNQEKTRNDGIYICKNLNIDYNTDAIKIAIENLKNIIIDINMYLSDSEILKNIKILSNKSNQLEALDVNIEVFKQLENKYNDMILSKGILQCPHCKGSVRYTNNTLEPESKIIYSLEDIEKTKVEINNMRKNIENGKMVNSYQEQIKELLKLLKIIKDVEKEIPDYCNNLNNYNNVLLTLQKLNYVEEPNISSENVLKMIEYQESLKLYETHIKSQDIEKYIKIVNDSKEIINSIPKDLDIELKLLLKELSELLQSNENRNKEFNEQIKKIQSTICSLNLSRSDNINKKSERIYIEDQINIFNTQIKELENKNNPNLFIQFEKLKQELINYQYNLEKSIYILEMLNKQKELEIKSNIINNTVISMSDLYALRQTAFDLECNHLQITVDSINESMNSVLEDIFDKPIKILLKLYKKNKTNEKIKASVNLSIYYDGNDYDSISKLSGGEKDRISFALTLALSRINGCPLLFLDETMTSLNDSLRTSCIECIRKFLGNSKTVVCINHEDVEGNYDDVKNLL